MTSGPLPPRELAPPFSPYAMNTGLRGFVAAGPDPGETPGRRSIDLGDDSELVYIPRFLAPHRSWTWFDYLNKEIPWTRPTVHVFGRSCLQPRDTCYVASEGLPELRYSGYQPPAYSWNEYPPLKDILQAVHEALPGSHFNSLLLNRYKGGSDYVAWHSDDEKLYGPTPEIASVSLGCDREFILKKKPKKSTRVDSYTLFCTLGRSSISVYGSGTKIQTTQREPLGSAFVGLKAWIFVGDEGIYPEGLAALGTEASEG